jgi:tetratricopeptide (TPR) repeat protein
VLKRLQRFDQALAAYEAVLALDPNDVDALNECGGLLMWLDRPAEAVACYERALAAARGIAELHINKGTALVALNRHQDALESFAAATAIDPERAGGALQSKPRALAAWCLPERLAPLRMALEEIRRCSIAPL